MRKSFRAWRVDYDCWQNSVQVDRKAREALVDRAWLDLDNATDRRRAREMVKCVEAHLNECVYLQRSVTRGPQRAHQIKRLRAVLTAQRALVRAIEGLDDWSWDHELSPQIDQNRCAMPDDPKNNGVSPLVPIAVTELGDAAESVIEAFRARARNKKTSAGHLRDEAISELAEVFHEFASPEMTPDAYRSELVGQAATRTSGFIAIVLKAAGLPVPEPRKMWMKIPQRYRTKKKSTTGAKAAPTRKR